MVCESVISSEWPDPLSSSIHFEKKNMIQGMYDVGVYIYTYIHTYIHTYIYIYILYIYIYHIYISYTYIYMVGGLEHFFKYIGNDIIPTDIFERVWWLNHHGTLVAPLLLHQSGWTPTPRGDECGPRMAKRARSMALYERREIQLWIPIVPW